MKNRIFATLSSLTLLTTAAAFAQGNPALEADIPFAFHIGTTILPAGHYELHPETVRNVLLIKCRACKASAMILMNRMDTGKKPEPSTLVFNRYNDTYFLSGVWLTEYSQGTELRKSKAELEFARNSSTSTPAAVALVRR